MYGRTTARKWPRSVCASGSLRHERFEQGLGPGLGPGVEDVETAAPEAPVSEAHAVLFSRAGVCAVLPRALVQAHAAAPEWPDGCVRQRARSRHCHRVAGEGGSSGRLPVDPATGRRAAHGGRRAAAGVAPLEERRLLAPLERAVGAIKWHRRTT